MDALTQAWSDAALAWLASPNGADWPGGEENKDAMANTLELMGLIHTQDKVAALTQAYEAMKRANVITPRRK